MSASEATSSSLFLGLLRALGSMLGVHLKYAQREAADDLGRVLSGLVLLVVALLLVGLALLFLHVALIVALERYTTLDWLRSVAAVGAGDLALALILALTARARLKKKVLAETRSLLRDTTAALLDSVTESR